MRFRKRPIIVEATQWFPGVDVAGVKKYPPIDGIDEAWFVETIHGKMAWLHPGDWVITEPDKIHHYPCKPDVFAATYEEAK